MKRVIASALTVCLLALVARPAQARDAWASVRTDNLLLISNAGEQELRQVAVWLELFHAAFARLLSKPVVNFSVPTTVVVFRDDASFQPFKPLYRGTAANVAGFFQPGPDVNYIALSLERGGRDSLSTAFHEYVHLHLRENMPDAPLWLNEGLAEFYSAFAISGGDATFGAPVPYYIRLLRGREPLPLATLFSVTQDSPHYNEQDKSGIFYAESWALVHYLMLGGGGRHRHQLTRFVNTLSAGASAEASVQMAFGMNLEALEGELKDYVRRGEFNSERVAVGRGPEDYVSAQRAALSEAEAYFYLGDLLLHINRPGDAEKYFQRSLSLDPRLAPTHAALGLLLVRQDRIEEAKKHLRIATATPQSHLVHYSYAYVLSRERAEAGGAASRYSPETAAAIRDELRKVIRLAPQFADAYYLLAFVNLVNHEQLDEAVDLAKRAQSLGGRLHYALLLAQIYLSRRDVESARTVLESLARQNTDPQVRSDAERLLASIDSPTGGTPPGSQTDIRARAGASVVRELGRSPSDSSGSSPRDGRTAVGGADAVVVDNSGPMPPLEQVIAWYVEAAGKPGVAGAMTSRVARGRLDIAGVSSGGGIEVYTKAPDKALTVMKAYPFGEVKFGFDGRAGWAQTSPGGLRSLTGLESGALRRDAFFYDPVKLREYYRSVRLLGRGKIGYREVYVLEMRPAAGDAERLYIDAKTHLPARLDAARVNAQGGAAYATVYLDDWREVDGLKMPFSISQSFPGLSVIITIEEVKQGVSIDDAVFNRPAKK